MFKYADPKELYSGMWAISIVYNSNYRRYYDIRIRNCACYKMFYDMGSPYDQSLSDIPTGWIS